MVKGLLLCQKLGNSVVQRVGLENYIQILKSGSAGLCRNKENEQSETDELASL
jgi:hypothetical protein